MMILSNRKLMLSASAAVLSLMAGSKSAEAALYAARATSNSTVQPAGPRLAPNGNNFFNIQGSNNNANASFGTLDYSVSAFNFGGGVTSVGSTMTLSLTESNAAFTAPGSLNFYITDDTTTVISNASPRATTPAFNATALPDGIGTQLGNRTLLGTGTFSTTGAVNSGQIDIYTLTLTSAIQTYLVNQLNTNTIFRLLVGPGTATTSATFQGFGSAGTSTTLTMDVTLNTPTLVWGGGTGSWDNVATNWKQGTTSVAWAEPNLAVFSTGSGTVTLAAPVSTSKGMRFDVSGYTVDGAGANNLTLTGAAGQNAIQVSSAGMTATISARVSGTNGLNKTGPGLLNLSGANDFTGGLTLTGGVVAVSADSALGSQTSGLVFNGGTLRASGTFAIPATRAAVTGTGIIDAVTGSTVTFNNTINAGSLTVGSTGNTGKVVLAGTTNTFSSAVVAPGATLTISGPLTPPASATSTTFFAFTGDGTVELATDNSAANVGVQISRGVGAVGPTLSFSSGTALGQGQFRLNAGVVNPTANTSLSMVVSLGGSATIAGSNLDLAGGLSFFGSSAKVLTINNATTISGSVTDNAPVDLNQLIKDGTGTLLLTGASNNYTEGTTVQGGTLTVASGSSLGGQDVLNLTTPYGPLVVSNPNTGAGTAVVLNLNNDTQTVGTLSGTIAAPSSGTNSATINLGTNHVLTVNQYVDGSYSGTIAGPTGSIVKAGPGKLTLNGVNTFGKSTTVSAGTLDASGGSIASSTGPMSVTGAGSQLIAKKIAPSSLTVGADAKVTLTNIDTSADQSGRSTVGTWDNSGLVDIGKTGIVIGTALEATIRGQILAARGLAPVATWTGTTGITSANAAANPSTRGIGYLVAGNQITVAQTVLGDANLDDVVNIDDLSLLAQNYNLTSKNWQTGDFNYDGTVNIDDLSLLAQNYNLTSSDTGAGDAAAFAADLPIAFGSTPIPEPGSVGLLSLGLVGLLARRRRQAVLCLTVPKAEA